jgi:hypothetical protein
MAAVRKDPFSSVQSLARDHRGGGTLWLGAIAFGYFYNAALALRWL